MLHSLFSAIIIKKKERKKRELVAILEGHTKEQKLLSQMQPKLKRK